MIINYRLVIIVQNTVEKVQRGGWSRGVGYQMNH